MVELIQTQIPPLIKQGLLTQQGTVQRALQVSSQDNSKKNSKVKFYFRHFTNTIACLALLPACNSAWAELVQGEDPSKLYFCSYAALQGENGLAREAAKQQAEMATMSEFIDYALRENLRLPESLSRLSDKIKQSLLVTGGKGQVFGAIVQKSVILNDGRAACLVEIPKSNLAHFKGLDVRNNPSDILNHLAEPRVLKMEISLELGLPTDLSAITPTSPLAKAMRGEAIGAISPLWITKVPIDESTMPHINDEEIMFLLEGAIAIPALQELLLANLSKRGYSKTAQYLTGKQLPCNQAVEGCCNFLQNLSTDCLANEPLLSILSQHQCAINFDNVVQTNTLLIEAKQKFAQAQPNFEEIKALLFKSFLVGVTDQSINLLGRCYEEEGKYNEAIVCYFQTYSINPENEYVGWNLANTFNKLGKKEEALYWAQSTLDAPSSNKWAAEMAAKLINDCTQEISPADGVLTNEDETGIKESSDSN